MRPPLHTKRLLFLLPALFAALALALAACGGESTPASGGGETESAAPPASSGETETTAAPASISVALDWFANPDHVGLFYAQDKGYWSDQNLDVTMKTPSDPSAGLKLVATKKFDVAVYYEGDMFFAAEQGLPVIAVGSMIPTPLNSIIATADSPVKSPSDFKGATIGNAGLPSDDAILQTIRQQQGLSEDDVKSVNVGFNLVPALLTHKADAVIGAYWNIEAFHIQSRTGKKPTVIQLADIGVPRYDELLIVANKDRLESEPEYADAVRRFIGGMIKGNEEAQKDEAGSIQIMEDESDYKPEEIEAMVPPTLGALEPPAGTPPGCFDMAAWQKYADWMVQYKLLKAPIDPSTVATNEYVPADCP